MPGRVVVVGLRLAILRWTMEYSCMDGGDDDEKGKTKTKNP